MCTITRSEKHALVARALPPSQIRTVRQATEPARRQLTALARRNTTGPVVMNTRAELVQAFEDYQAGRLGTIPAEARPGHEVLRDNTSEQR